MSNEYTAVIPVAGLGTRLLPASAVIPKELFPIAAVPALQWVFHELVSAGVSRVILVSSKEKPLIEGFVQVLPRLAERLAADAANPHLAASLAASAKLNIEFVYQDAPLGLGHAVLQAEPLLDSAFIVALPDELYPTTSPIPDLVASYRSTSCSALSLMEVAPESVSSYGIASLGPDHRPCSVVQSIPVQDLVEKPSPAAAPSQLAVVGRYLCTTDVFDHLHRTAPGSGGEIQFTDALAALATSHGLYGCISEVSRVDIGNRAGLAAASALTPPWEG